MYRYSKFSGCVECSKWLSHQVYDYSINHFGAPLCMPCQNRLRSSSATAEAQSLYLALKQQGVPAMLEWFDGYKTIDIAIPKHHLYIEVDGMQHTFSNKQALADLWRTFYSFRDGIHTVRLPNDLIRNEMKETVESLLRFVSADRNRHQQQRF